MGSDDRELLEALRRQQQELRARLEGLERTLGEIEGRRHEELRALLPPLPDSPPVVLPPVPAEAAPLVLPPLPIALPPLPEPSALSLPPLPSVPSPAAAPSRRGRGFEFHLIRALGWAGAVLLLVGLIALDATQHLHRRLGAGGTVGLLALASLALVWLGRKREPARAWHGMLGLAGWAGGFALLAAAAHAPRFQVVSPALGTAAFILWSLLALAAAGRRGAPFLAALALLLGMGGLTAWPGGGLALFGELLLTELAARLTLRRGWWGLAYLALLGVGVAFLRELLFDEDNALVFDTSRALPFGPHGLYAVAAWAALAAVPVLAAPERLGPANRLVLVTLSNLALAFLLGLAVFICGYGLGAIGWTLLGAGALALLAAAGAAILAGTGPAGLWKEAGIGEGLALLTLGLIVSVPGVERAWLLVVETFALGGAAAFTRSRVFMLGTCGAALLAAVFAAWEIGWNGHQPWELGLGAAAVLLLNAWWSSRGHPSRLRETGLFPATYYAGLALVVTGLVLNTQLGDNVLPPALALLALACTLLVHFVPLEELPPLAQLFLIAAQLLVLFPADTGTALSRGSGITVALVTLAVMTWWTRRPGAGWGAHLLNGFYALVLAGLVYHALRPWFDVQGWMAVAALLAVGFLIYGACTRLWLLAAAGQLFLASAAIHFFFPPGGPGRFPWNGWLAALLLAAVLASGRALRGWMRAAPGTGPALRHALLVAAKFHFVLALAILVGAIFGLAPAGYRLGTLLFLGPLLLEWNLRRGSPFGVRCSFLPPLVALALLLAGYDPGSGPALFTAAALLALLAGPVLLRRVTPPPVQPAESWGFILATALAGWLLVSRWITAHFGPVNLTLAWIFYALLLVGAGLVAREPRLRTCGLIVVVAAIVRVLAADVWNAAAGHGVLAFILLAALTLGLGLLYRFSGRAHRHDGPA